jgi:isopentenyl diphosphate isomerase/L-lactate dehydrogenase-like FMN-dependent dehydrogenase
MADPEPRPDSTSGDPAAAALPGPVSFGLSRQMEIYQAGLSGRKPELPLTAEELELKARGVLPPEAFTYVAGGAGNEDTVRANRDAYRRWRIVPRFLRDVSRRDLSVVVLGRRFPAPLMMAPIGVQSMLHADAELAVARAARSLGVPLILSTVSAKPMEAIAAAMGDVPHWFQLYWPGDKDLAASFVKRAEKAGFSAIVVTLDTYLLGWRERDLQLGWLPFLHGQGLANFFTDPVFRASLPVPPEKDPVPAVRRFLEVFSNSSLTWTDLAFLRMHTKLPIILKGILHPEDALLAVEHGVAGVIVSNHGGRQVDGAVASLDALPGVVDAVNGKVDVLFDGGIRRGSDVFKAIALGAKCVLLGRPYCYGLALGGEDGVREVVRNVLADTDLTMGLAGCASIGEVNQTNVLDSRL